MGRERGAGGGAVVVGSSRLVVVPVPRGTGDPFLDSHPAVAAQRLAPSVCAWLRDRFTTTTVHCAEDDSAPAPILNQGFPFTRGHVGNKVSERSKIRRPPPPPCRTVRVKCECDGTGPNAYGRRRRGMRLACVAYVGSFYCSFISGVGRHRVSTRARKGCYHCAVGRHSAWR